MTQTAASTSPTKWAREYETIYILRPNVDPDEAEKIAQRVREVMERLSGTLTKVDNWGTRKLAYTIRKFTRGIFIYVRYVAFNDVVAELERNLRLFEPIMRYQTIVLRDMVDPRGVQVEAEDVEFVRIEKGEDEPELDRAQRLGLTPVDRPSRMSEESIDEEVPSEEEPAAAEEDSEADDTEASDDESEAQD